MQTHNREQLIAAMRYPDPATREPAVQEMANREDPAWLPLFLEAVRDPSPGVRWRATRALMLAGGNIAGPELAFLLSDGNVRVRAEAVRLFGKSANPGFLDVLLPLLADADVEVRSRAIEAVGDVGERDEVLTARLGPFLEDPDPRIRMHAAAALGKIGTPSAVPALIRRLNDSRPQVRGFSAWSLGMLDDERCLVPLIALLEDEGEHVRLFAYQAVSSFGSRAEAVLRDRMSGEEAPSPFMRKLLEELAPDEPEPM